MHNVGQKSIRIHHDEKSDRVVVKEGTVVAFTLFRDEIQPHDWSFAASHPVKYALKSMGFEESYFQGPPWRRSWVSQGSKCEPLAASSIQFHARIDPGKVEGYLKQSGTNGIYVTPKNKDNMADAQYSVVWVDKSPIEISQILVQFPEHLGQIRVSKIKGNAGKNNRGVRCRQEDFKSLFAKLRPGDDIPEIIPIAHMYKVQPIPIGAKYDDILKWMKINAWHGRPVKSLNEKSWLVGSTKPFEHEFLMWNDQCILVKAVNTRMQHKTSPVLAGAIPNDRLSQVSSGSSQTHDSYGNYDPWGKYSPTMMPGTNGSFKFPNASTQSARQVDAPTEAKFTQQNERISKLQSDFDELKTQVMKRDEQAKSFEQQATAEFKLVRSEMANQVSQISQNFQHSLETALKRQDAQMSSSFDELKQLLCRSQTNPQKKAKAAKPGGEEPEGKDTDMADL